jgi:hypothetical protein
MRTSLTLAIRGFPSCAKHLERRGGATAQLRHVHVAGIVLSGPAQIGWPGESTVSRSIFVVHHTDIALSQVWAWRKRQNEDALSLAVAATLARRTAAVVDPDPQTTAGHWSDRRAKTTPGFATVAGPRSRLPGEAPLSPSTIPPARAPTSGSRRPKPRLSCSYRSSRSSRTSTRGPA